MKKELTSKQKADITRMYRKEFKSIKYIAKELHLSDRRVSAFLGGKNAPKDNPNPPKATKHAKNLYDTSSVEVYSDTDPVKDFVAGINCLTLDSIREIIKGKKPSRKEMEQSLVQLSDTFVEAVALVAIAVVLELAIGGSKRPTHPAKPKKGKKA